MPIDIYRTKSKAKVGVEVFVVLKNARSRLRGYPAFGLCLRLVEGLLFGSI